MSEENNGFVQAEPEEVPVVEYISEETPAVEAEQSAEVKTAEEQEEGWTAVMSVQAGQETAQERNILTEKKEALEKIRDELAALEQQGKEIVQTSAQREKAEKEAVAAEKKMQDTLAAVLKKRRDELANTFNKEIEKDQVRLKTIRGNREKAKTRGMKARIDTETSDLVQENKRISESISTLFRQKGIPGLCNSRVFYTLFYPKGIWEILIFAGTWLAGLVLIPWLVTWLTGWPTWGKALLWLGIALLWIAAYVGIRIRTKDNFHTTLKEMRVQRDVIQENKAKINQIKRAIRKDPDESHYNLESFDTEITALEESIRLVAEKREQALEEFETNSRPVIVKEILAQYKPKVEELRAQAAQIGRQQQSMEEQAKNARADLMSRYGNFVGSEFMNVTKTEALIAILESGRANTVQEAKQLYLQK